MLPERILRDFQFVFVGPPGWKAAEIESSLEDLMRRHPASTIRCGFLEDAELEDLLEGAFALLFPSLYEGFGLPILEAMQMGVPVLTSLGGATEEVAGKAALLVDPRSAESISKGIQSLAEKSDLRSRLIEAGKIRVQGFSISKGMLQLKDRLERLMD